jgi:hypothetical protein
MLVGNFVSDENAARLSGTATVLLVLLWDKTAGGLSCSQRGLLVDTSGSETRLLVDYQVPKQICPLTMYLFP